MKVRLTDWDKEEHHLLGSRRAARVFMMGKLLVKYTKLVGDMSLEELAKRLGYELNYEDGK